MLSPEEIAAKEFLPAMRGYRRQDVRDFLAAIAEEVRSLQAELDNVRRADPHSPGSEGRV